MTVLALYRRPRRILRRLIKPAALWLNAYCYRRADFEIARLRAVRMDATLAESRQHVRQVELTERRAEIGGWE